MVIFVALNFVFYLRTAIFTKHMGSNGAIDLSYLREISAEDNQLLKELIDMFIQQVPEYQTQLQKDFEQQKWEQLGRTAHKVKASLTMVGLNDLATQMKQLELQAKKGEQTELYKGYIDAFIQETTEAIKELKEVKKNY